MARTLRAKRLFRRQLLISVLGLVAVAVLLLGVFPTRTYLQQRSELQIAQRQLSLLKSANKQLDDRAQQLQTDGEIERLAREKYNLVKPGEQAYGLLPAAGEIPKPVTLAPKRKQKSTWSRIVDDLTFWR